MKKKILFAFFFCTFSFVHSQIRYEPGYIIDLNGKKSEVLIRNLEWVTNPIVVNYKINENSEVLEATSKEIMEFKVDNFHYVATSVDVDQSSHITRDLSTHIDPEFKEETLFLRYLVKGSANLYILDRNNNLYFYNLGNKPIEPLIYKKYESDDKIFENTQFRSQLHLNLRCDNMDLSNVRNIEYKKNALVNYFIEYNKCLDKNYVFEIKKRDGDFNLSVKAGVGPSNLEVERDFYVRGIELKSVEYRASAELEYIFPFNKNKWALYLEPAYRNSSFKDNLIIEGLNADLTVQYTSVELGFGARHNLFLNEDSKLFLSVGYVYDIPVQSEVFFAITDIDPILTNFENSFSLNLGVGFNYKSKYLFEAKYVINRPFRGSSEVPEIYYLNWRSKYSALSLLVGYRLF